jgi:hypothetical protein
MSFISHPFAVQPVVHGPRKTFVALTGHQSALLLPSLRMPQWLLCRVVPTPSLANLGYMALLPPDLRIRLRVLIVGVTQYALRVLLVHTVLVQVLLYYAQLVITAHPPDYLPICAPVYVRRGTYVRPRVVPSLLPYKYVVAQVHYIAQLVVPLLLLCLRVTTLDH